MIFVQRPDVYECEQTLSVDMLARSERFIADLPALKRLGYREIGALRKVSQVDAAISVAKSHLLRLGNPPVGRVIYCSFWNDEIWTEFHCAKIHHELDLLSNVPVVNLRVNGSTGIFMAIELAQAFIAANPGRGVLLAAADKIDVRFVRRKFSGGLFGDGAAATYFSDKPIKEDGIWIASSPQYEIDGRYHRLDAYEDDANGLQEASKVLQARLMAQLSQQVIDVGPVPFLHQPGSRFVAESNDRVFQPFSGDWSRRGYLPASGLLHVLTDFLSGNHAAGKVALGEASVGLQYAGVVGSVGPLTKY